MCVRGCGFANAVLLSRRGVVRVDVNLQDVDIDQCSADGWFAGTHRCNATTMEVSERPLATPLTALLAQRRSGRRLWVSSGGSAHRHDAGPLAGG